MEQVGFGIIGCGNIAPIHAQCITEIPQARLVAVADVQEERRKKMAAEYGAEEFGDYKEMLARDDVHAVSLCVPSGMRAEMAEICAQAGKHILAEKPLEVSTERIDRILNAAGKAGVKLGCIFQNRFADAPARVHEALQEGRFGKLILGDAYIKWFRSQEYYDSGAWRGTKQLDGGGALMNQGVHQIDLLCWFMGPVDWVYADKDLVAHTGLEVEDLACAIIRFKNGARGVIEGSTAIWPGYPARVEVHGTDGSAVIEDGALTAWNFRQDRETDQQIRDSIGKESVLGSTAADPMANLRHEGHLRQIEDFTQAILEDRKPQIDGREGRPAVELIEAIYQSAETGEVVKL